MALNKTITAAGSWLEFKVYGKGSSGCTDGDGRFEIIISGLTSSVVSLQVSVGDSWVTTDTLTMDGLFTAASVASRMWRVGCVAGDFADGENIYIEVAQ